MALDIPPTSPSHIRSASLITRARASLTAFVEGGPRASAGKEEEFRRAGAYMLGSVMLVLLLLSMALNILEGAYSLLGPLLLACIAPISAFILLWKKKDSADIVLVLLNGTLFLLGVDLLLVKGAPHGGSLLWFTVFPPMAMLSMGLKRGTVIFALFYVFLLAVMLTPLHAYLAEPLPPYLRLRFLLVMLGAFLFSWWAEFLRYYTHCALRRAGEKLDQEAHTDPLTNLGNRRDFEKSFTQVRSKA